MKVAELREELKAMGQPTEGTKPELIERLVASHQAEADSEDEEMDTEKKGCAEGAPLLNKLDESTTTPGLFLVGPAVRHGDLSFCFVYKFRQRFGIVADAIAKGLGRETAAARAAGGATKGSGQPSRVRHLRGLGYPPATAGD